MRKVALFFLVTAAVTALGCQAKSETTVTREAPAPAAPAPAPAASTTPAMAPMAPTAPMAPMAPGEIGIAECDAYISKWESCLATKITGDAKEQTRVALDATREGWKRMAASPDSRVHLAAACKEASEVAVMQVGAYGCTW